MGKDQDVEVYLRIMKTCMIFSILIGLYYLEACWTFSAIPLYYNYFVQSYS